MSGGLKWQYIAIIATFLVVIIVEYIYGRLTELPAANAEIHPSLPSVRPPLLDNGLAQHCKSRAPSVHTPDAYLAADEYTPSERLSRRQSLFN